ncbi:hypothetical protein AAMO2058_000612200 [Amorphochlora amoebiformis]
MATSQTIFNHYETAYRSTSSDSETDSPSSATSPHSQFNVPEFKLGFVRGVVTVRESIRIMTACLDQKINSGRRRVPAFVFDIDGVFKNGGKYAPYGAGVLRKLQTAKIPYVFMTNGGGGRTEEQYAIEMSKKIASFDSTASKPQKGVYAQEDQMVLSYSPFKTHLKHLKNEHVLIVGCPRAMNAAEEFGFKHTTSMRDYAKRHSTMNPFHKGGCEKDDKVVSDEKETWDEDFKAILVFTDPSDFFESLQIITDLLLSSRPGEVEYEKNHRIPIVFSNPDLLWKSQFKFPRFGQGAFRLSLEACYKARMQAMNLPEEEIQERLSDFIQFGKPYDIQFLHARRAAVRQAEKMESEISHFYMVGDNPASDILGAVRMNALSAQKGLQRWSGLLVRSGVYNEGEDPKGASKIFDTVVQAVEYGLKHNSHNAQSTAKVEA